MINLNLTKIHQMVDYLEKIIKFICDISNNDNGGKISYLIKMVIYDILKNQVILS